MKLEDYLHYYPEVSIAIIETPGAEPVGHYLEGIDRTNNKVIAERVNWDFSQIKPILRKLDSLTEEEKIELIKLHWTGAIEELISVELKEVTFSRLSGHSFGYSAKYIVTNKEGAKKGERKESTLTATMVLYNHNAKQWMYLLSLGMDLFGLIKADLAIDKATLK